MYARHGHEFMGRKIVAVRSRSAKIGDDFVVVLPESRHAGILRTVDYTPDSIEKLKDLLGLWQPVLFDFFKAIA